ncbi:MAG TPA: sulfite exporter TauE/SafE family protein [Solimonas sp.]
MPLTDALILAVAAGLAGALNAVAGGGSFLTLPALMLAGLPPVAANATGTLALLPGYLSASWATREDVPDHGPLASTRTLALAAVGGLCGAALLTLTPDRWFAVAAPGLVFAATLLFAAQPHLRLPVASSGSPRVGAVALFAVCVYGGYFNGGLGILLLAALNYAGASSLTAANAIKNRLSAVLTTIAAAIYIAAGEIHWPAALWMTLFAIIGGYLGARGARRLSPRLLRIGIVAIGLSIAAALAWARPD